MKIVELDEAAIHLSELVDEAVNGQPFVISLDGKPMVRVEAIEEVPLRTNSRIGFMEGQMTARDKFKEIGREEIEEMFELNAQRDLSQT